MWWSRRFRQARCRCRSTRPASSSTSTPSMLEILQYQFAKGYAEPARCCRAGIAARASRRHAAAAAQATGAATRPAGGSGRPVSEPGAGGQIRACRACNCRRICRSAFLPNLWRSVRMCSRPRRTCTSASAQIGIAIANRLPNFELTANAGSTALAIGQLFNVGHGLLGVWVRT